MQKFLILFYFVSFGSGKSNFIPTEKEKQDVGINLATEIYESVCWYEYLKVYLPKTHSLDFNRCHGQGNFQRNIVFKHGAPEKFFGQFLMEHGMDKLPPQYMACSPLLLDERNKKPQIDYSHAVLSQDQKESWNWKDEPFPYKAFAYCMIEILQEKYQDGLATLNDRLIKETSYSEAMFNRENEFRALHSAPPLTLNDELTQRAQKWADQLALSCQMYHIHSSHPDYYLNGSRMGENLFTGDGINSPKQDMALFGTNIWYEEIEYYPWPEYKGFGSDPFLKFSHFSQMIWKETEEVGYGYAINGSENCGQYFIVARYFPPGNFYGRFKENILPIRKS